MSIALLEYGRYSPRPKSKADGAHPDSDGDTLARSLDAQASEIAEYCRRRGLHGERFQIHDELVSARKTPLAKRPGGAKLLKMIASGECREVIVTEMNRLFRDTVDGLTTLRAWHDLGVVVHTTRGVSFDVSTADGELVATVLLATDAAEPKRSSERTRASHEANKLNNTRTTRYPRWGFMFDETGPRHPVSDKPTQEIEHHGERKIIEYARQLQQRGHTLEDIARSLNKRLARPQESRCSRGKAFRFYPSMVKRIIEADC